MSENDDGDAASITRKVAGRPTGYAGGENERRWKSAVRGAFSAAVLPGTTRIRVDMDFILTADQLGRREPDLDNLIKSTIDALEGVLGRRSGTGARVEADDVRVARILASKRHGLDGEPSGARIVVSQLPENAIERP